MTVSEAHPAKRDEPQASLRTELIGQLVAAQFDLETAIADMMRDGAPASAVLDGRSQLGAVIALRQQIAGADVKTLAAMRSDIAAVIASSQSAAQQARAAVDAAQGAGGISLAAASREARASVTSFMGDYYKDKKFDAYLHFSSPEDEEKFRQREKERQEEIDRAKALNTPEGNLRATRLALEQLKDAGAHGATASPDYQKDLDKLSTGERLLTDAMPTKGNGKEAQIQSAPNEPDPLDAIKPSLDASRDEIAILKAAGVVVADQGVGHGVNAGIQRQEGQQRQPT